MFRFDSFQEGSRQFRQADEVNNVEHSDGKFSLNYVGPSFAGRRDSRPGPGSAPPLNDDVANTSLAACRRVGENGVATGRTAEVAAESVRSL